MKFNQIIESLEVYEAGKPIELLVREFGIEPKDIIKMASNENPYGVSKRVSQKIAESSSRAYIYPDDSMYSLKDSLSKHYGVDSSEVIIGSGSDQVLEFITRAVLNENSKVLQNSVTFAMYSIYSKQLGAEIIKTDSLNHDLDQFLQLSKEHNPEIIFICTPNNPTGDAIEREELYSFLDKVDPETLVVVDGAYMEYAKARGEEYGIEPKDLISRYRNVIYLGTFSKAYGLGGMRVGYGISREEIIENLYKIRPPFNVTTLSLVGAEEALQDQEFVKSSIEKNFTEMSRFKEFLNSRKIKFIDSYTNFITILLPNDIASTDIADSLLKKGIIIRDLSGYGLNAVRVTVGRAEENSKLFNALNTLL
jgi:histidinol-phosphate aminotransferase